MCLDLDLAEMIQHLLRIHYYLIPQHQGHDRTRSSVPSPLACCFPCKHNRSIFGLLRNTISHTLVYQFPSKYNIIQPHSTCQRLLFVDSPAESRGAVCNLRPTRSRTRVSYLFQLLTSDIDTTLHFIHNDSPAFSPAPYFPTPPALAFHGWLSSA